MVLANNLENTEVESAAGLLHPLLGARLGERLARESGSQDIVSWDFLFDFTVTCVHFNIPERSRRSPVPLIHSCCVLVDLNGVDEFSAHSG